MYDDSIHPRPYWGLPDPDRDWRFYRGVPAKRLFAWLIDVVLTTALVALAIPLTAFVGLFFLPVLWLVVSFVYRAATLAAGSATWGMRFVGIELRRGDGARADNATAMLHTGLYLGMTVLFPAQLISMLLMLVTPRGQGLHDLLLGTAVINRPEA